VLFKKVIEMRKVKITFILECLQLY
jgi:hypothetical protein